MNFQDLSFLKLSTYTLLLLSCTAIVFTSVSAEETKSASAEEVKAPRIFLNKSARIVEYQLKRLTNAQLLLVERATDDAKYKPVFDAILKRPGMSRQHRNEALKGLVALNKSNSVSEILSVLESLDVKDRSEQSVGRQLASVLVLQSVDDLKASLEGLKEAATSDNSILQSAGYAGIIAAGQTDSAVELGMKSSDGKAALLNSITMIPRKELRNPLRDSVVKMLDSSESPGVQKAAIRAVASLTENIQENYKIVSNYLSQPEFRVNAVSTLLKIKAGNKDPKLAEELLKVLTEFAENTPAADRTTDKFLDAMQLADQLIAVVPVETARSFRERLSLVSVRVVTIHTVEEEMRYDLPYFAVQAGRPVQVVLKNEDLMPHNLVFTVPDALKEVANVGAGMPQGEGPNPIPYVPNSDKVLHASDMIQADKTARLTFTAPSTPGEYPYVCTFPRHWMRMYGVMVVVDDLDAWLKNPVKPKDPIGSNRSFVQSWKTEDFATDLDTGLKGRIPKIGEKLFAEATCALCHKMKEKGGAVGPALDDVVKRWKGDKMGVLREILDPSHKVDPKYAMTTIVDGRGRSFTGLVVKEDKKTVSILTDPEAKEPKVFVKKELLDLQKSPLSMMPKALLDKFTKDEIFELLSYVYTSNP